MSITSGSLSKSFVVVSDTAPSSPFEGQLWRDTTTDTLKQWDGSSWVDVQSSPDGKTIVKDSSGNIGTAERTVRVGSFENGMDGWVKTGGTLQISERDTYTVKRGSYSYRLYDNDNVVTGGIKINKDLSNFDNLYIWVYQSRDGSSNKFQVKIDGTLEYDSNTDRNNWIELNIDVSNYSGSKDIELLLNRYDTSSTAGYYVDNIRLSKTVGIIQGTNLV